MVWTLLFGTALLTPQTPAVNIIPKPTSVVTGSGQFAFNSQTVVVAKTSQVASFVIPSLRTLTGDSLKIVKSERRSNYIEFMLDPSLKSLTDEGYKLSITPTAVFLSSSSEKGLFYAWQSLRQLLPADLELAKPKTQKITLPCVEITDKPRFSWRGLHLDVSRHFFTVDEIKRTLDLMALFKLNTFHWHLVDDGGWRLEIKKYPRLTDVGAWRAGDGKGWDQGSIKFLEPNDKTQRYGGFYTQNQVKDVLAYAHKRNIEIVPEIEMPGHNLPANWAYPSLACDKVALDKLGIQHPNVFCPGKETTYAFLQNVLDEVIALFPSKVIHIGADEVDRRAWDICPACLQKMKDENLADDAELQSYFVRRMASYLQSKGRTLIGWDEILDGGLPKTAMVMSWRGISGGIEAAKQDKDVVMCPTSHCYFDYPYTSISTEQVYGYEPVPDEIPAAQQHHVLGGQGNLWTEHMENFARVEFMAFPRAEALAEVLWSDPKGRSWDEFKTRLSALEPRMDALGVHYFLAGPDAATNFALFQGQATIDFPRNTNRRPIVFTLDGTVPTAQSPVFTKPMTVTKDTVINAAYVAGGRIGDVTTVSFKKFVAQPLDTYLQGTTASYFYGTYSKVAEYAKLKPTRTEIIPNFDISRAKKDEFFAVRYDGYLKVPKAGVYTFWLSSDDGSILSLDGTTAIDFDGLHGPSIKSGRLSLPATYIPFRLDFFQNGGAQLLKLEVEGPGIPRQLVPDSWLFCKP